jgi:hypothetical protein
LSITKREEERMITYIIHLFTSAYFWSGVVVTALSTLLIPNPYEDKDDCKKEYLLFGLKRFLLDVCAAYTLASVLFGGC